MTDKKDNVTDARRGPDFGDHVDALRLPLPPKGV